MIPGRFDDGRLIFSWRRMLNRLGLESQTVEQLRDQVTGQTHEAARSKLRDLEAMGYADEHPDGWRISDEGIAAMATSGVIYSNGVDR